MRLQLEAKLLFVKFHRLFQTIDLEEQQIEANKAAAANAQTTANQGVAAAGQAQTSANKAQSSANQAQSTAMAAGTGAVMDAEAISLVNKRVSDLGDYKTVVEAALFFESDQATLSADEVPGAIAAKLSVRARIHQPRGQRW